MIPCPTEMTELKQFFDIFWYIFCILFGWCGEEIFFRIIQFSMFSLDFFHDFYEIVFCPNSFPAISINPNDEWNETEQHNFFLIFMFKHKILRSFRRSLSGQVQTRTTDSRAPIRLTVDWKDCRHSPFYPGMTYIRDFEYKLCK